MSDGPTVFCTHDTRLTFEWDGTYDVSEDDAREWLHENGIDPVSIETHADRFEHYFNVEDGE